MNFCLQKLKRRILATFGFNRLATLDVLRRVFEYRLRADIVWPPRSCDLDYYLWGAVKDMCYADKPDTIDAAMKKFHKYLSFGVDVKLSVPPIIYKTT